MILQYNNINIKNAFLQSIKINKKDLKTNQNKEMSQGQDLQKGIKFMKVVTTFTQTKHLLISIQNHELLVNLINTVLHNKFLLKVRNSFNKIRVLIYLNLSAKLRLTITLNTNNNKKIIKFRMKHHNSN